MILAVRHFRAARQRREEAGDTSRLAAILAKPATLAVMVAGAHLMLFWAVIRWAWNAGDLMGAGIITGMMVTLGILAFLRMRNQTVQVASRVVNSHLGVCAMALLATINLRFDVWAASSFGVSVAEIHQRLPTWIIPVLTLPFLIL